MATPSLDYVTWQELERLGKIIVPLFTIIGGLVVTIWRSLAASNKENSELLNHHIDENDEEIGSLRSLLDHLIGEHEVNHKGDTHEKKGR